MRGVEILYNEIQPLSIIAIMYLLLSNRMTLRLPYYFKKLLMKEILRKKWYFLSANNANNGDY